MQNQKTKNIDGPIIFYDGECGLCNRFVQFMLHHDGKDVVRFAALQGATYEQTVRCVLGPPDMTTVVLWESGVAYTHSDAVLRAISRLGGVMGAFSSVALWIPRSLRDFVYRFVSRNRYRWFGKVDACRIPQGNERDRFLP